MFIRPNADRAIAIAAASFAAIAVLIVFVLPSDLLLSARDSDMISEYVASRAFLAENIGRGHLPLWNPFTYSGQPFLAGFESAALYPPNLLFLFLPLAPALNLSMLLHLIILGWGMAQWALARGVHRWAAGLAGLILPLSGAVFPHMYAGHLLNLCTMAWAPWTFLGLEVWIRGGGRRWLLLASAAACLQVLAGHVQYCFFVAIAAGLQAIIISVIEPTTRRRAFPAVALCYLGAVVLAAAQLLPSMAVAAETLRQQKLDYSFAARFGFPPENLLTMIAPAFFGRVHSIYWGRSYLWEASLFIGASGLPLIAVALFNRDRKPRELGDLILVALLLAIALGVHTPLFQLLYEFAPGFSHFRAWSKFIFPATLFLVLLIATGADILLRGRRPARQVVLGSMFFGLATIAVGVFLVVWPQTITGLFQAIVASHESYLTISNSSQSEFIGYAGHEAGLSLVQSGLVIAATGVVFLLVERWPFLRWGIPTVLLIELVGFAGEQLATSRLSDAMPESLRQFVAAHPGDYRVVDLSRPTLKTPVVGGTIASQSKVVPGGVGEAQGRRDAGLADEVETDYFFSRNNNGFLLGASDLTGNNPAVLRRYAEFMTFNQRGDPNKATQYLYIRKLSKSYAMLRLRYIFVPSGDGFRVVESAFPPLPRLLLISNWQLLNGRDAIFSSINNPSFDPRDAVLLENEPEPRPELRATASAKLISELPDELTIEVDTDKPTLLLVTDLYESSWRAEPLPGSVQQSYRVMPADYILRAVPLMAGHHRLRFVYAPAGFVAGIGFSIVGWLLWAALFYFAPSSTTRK